MVTRIINLTCPNCKYGIKHDTVLNTTTVTPPEEYPKVNERGRCWCKQCQHGTYPNEDGLCIECLPKGRETRLRPEGEMITVTNEVAQEMVYKGEATIPEEATEDVKDVFEPETATQEEAEEMVASGEATIPEEVIAKKVPVKSKSMKKRTATQKAAKI